MPELAKLAPQADPMEESISRARPKGFSSLPISSIIAIVAMLSMLAWTYRSVLAWLFRTWSNDPDYSHGFLVPLFAIGLLWIRRKWWPNSEQRVAASALACGVALIALGAATQAAGIYVQMLTLEAVSLLPFFAGIALCWGGWPAARLAWPSVAFLVFMFPLPGAFSGLMSEALQRVATIASTFLMQLIGIPAVAEGNIIWLAEGSIGVAEACSGLRMLVSFFALTVGTCFVIERPFWEKAVVVLSAPLIAVFANVVRITATGIAYNFGNSELADKIFHDLAGWLMMPLGLGILFVQLSILAAIFLPGEDSRGLHGMTFAVTDGAARKPGR